MKGGPFACQESGNQGLVVDSFFYLRSQNETGIYVTFDQYSGFALRKRNRRQKVYGSIRYYYYYIDCQVEGKHHRQFATFLQLSNYRALRRESRRRRRLGYIRRRALASTMTLASKGRIPSRLWELRWRRGESWGSDANPPTAPRDSLLKKKGFFRYFFFSCSYVQHFGA